MSPKADGAHRYSERGLPRETDAGATRSGILPREEGQDRAGVADLVAIIEMVGGRIVEVDCLLDEAKPEGAGIEVQVTPGVAGNRGHVMNAGHDLPLVFRGVRSSLISFAPYPNTMAGLARGFAIHGDGVGDAVWKEALG